MQEEGQFSQDVHSVPRQTLMCAEPGRVWPSLQRWLPGVNVFWPGQMSDDVYLKEII